MVALPCTHLTLRAQKPCNPAYPEHLKTLGDYIRKRRLDLGLHQKDVAALVNATNSTVTNWEKNRTRPTLEFLPRIIEFLGYDPISLPGSSLGEKLKRYRRIRGQSIERLAEELGVDPTTIAKWERGKTTPSRRFQRVISALFRSRH